MNDFESDDNLDCDDEPQNSCTAPRSCVARPRIGKRNALAIEPKIAPIERFEIPLHLDGSIGDFRCAVDKCHIQVETDLEAIDWWLTRTSQTETTMTARRAAVEKLINWAIIVRKRAISSLTETDFAAFSRFLSDPQPAEKWIYPGQVPRASDDWRPFRRPLSAGARDGNMKQISALVKWMASVRYADLRCFVGVRAMNDGFATAAVYGEGGREPEPPITVEEWHEIRQLLDERFPADDVTSHPPPCDAHAAAATTAAQLRLWYDFLSPQGQRGGGAEVSSVPDCTSRHRALDAPLRAPRIEPTQPLVQAPRSGRRRFGAALADAELACGPSGKRRRLGPLRLGQLSGRPLDGFAVVQAEL